MTPQLELFLRLAAGLCLVPLLWGLIGRLVESEEAEEADDEPDMYDRATESVRRTYGRGRG